MDLVFKVTNPGAQAGREVVGDTNFKTHNPALHQNMAWATLEPLILQASEDYVVKYIGEEIYDDIAAKFQADTKLTGNQPKLLRLVQDACAWYAGYHAAMTLNISVADMGAQQQSAKEGTSGPPSQWAFKNSIWHYLEMGDRALDKLLSFMEKAVKDGDTYFDLWKNSDAYTFKKSAFFREAKDLDDFLNIECSFRTFKALTNHLKAAETKYVLPILCSTEFENLETKVKDGTASGDYATLLEHVRRTVAHYALWEAVPHLSMKITESGFRVVTQTDGFDRKESAKNGEHTKLRDDLKYRSELNGKNARANLISFLYSKKDVFTDWAGSSCYKESDGSDYTITASLSKRGGIGIWSS